VSERIIERQPTTEQGDAAAKLVASRRIDQDGRSDAICPARRPRIG
jgi:hypothetical protein